MKYIIAVFIFLNAAIYANELKKVSIQFMWHDQYEFAGFYIAKEKGYYKDLGLDVEFIKFSANTNITNKVINGEATFGTGSSSLIIDKSKGKDIVLLGSVFQSSPLILLGLKRFDLKTVSDIKNKKIMLTADQQRFATLQAMLVSKHVQLNDIKILKHTFDVDDLINKTTDLMLAYTTNEPYILKEKGYEGEIFHPKDYGFDFYEELIFTSKRFSNENPKIVEDFYKATVKGWKYAFDNIDEVSKLVYEKYNPQKKSLKSLIFEAEEMKKLAFTKKGEFGIITKEKLTIMEYSYRILGLLKENLNIDDLIFSKKQEKKSILTKHERQYLDINKFVTMCIDPDWMPFEGYKNGKHIGIGADFIELMRKTLNTSIKVIPTKSWKQSLEYGKNRKCDIFSFIMNTTERKKFLNFTKPYLDVPFALASNIEASFIEKISYLRNKKIAVVKDYAYSELLRIKYPEVNFIEVESIREGLDKTQKKELFGFIGSLITIGYEIQNNYLGQLKINGKFEESIDLSVGTRNDRPILKSIFNKAIANITPEQKQTILNKWVNINYEKKIDYTFFYAIIFIIFIFVTIAGIIYRQYILNVSNKELNKKVKEEIYKNNQQHKILTQQTKKVAMGEMLENIAHQWRQPLSVISVAATGIRMKKEYGTISDKELFESIDSINDSAQFLSKTIDDFRDFYSETKYTNEFNIKDTIKKSLQLFGVQYNNYNITIVENIKDVKINNLENELIQVLINLLNNSKDALTDIKHKKIVMINTYEENNHLVIQLKDSADGIPTKILDKIFEPYFTTKHKSQGTGIGLYMCEQIITKHMGGTIEASNETFTYENITFNGASFTITLPLLMPE